MKANCGESFFCSPEKLDIYAAYSVHLYWSIVFGGTGNETTSGSCSHSCFLYSFTFLGMSHSINGGGKCWNFSPILVGDDTKTAPAGDIFDQPPCPRSSIRTKLADHAEDHHVVLFSGGTVLLTSPGTESLNPPPPQPLNDSIQSALSFNKVFAWKTRDY